MPPQTQNRKDLLQAYRLMTQRTALALIAGEPDSPNQPLRRRNMATVSGVLAGVIACAVFGVMGMLSHGGAVNGLTSPGTLVIDKDTATAYVPCTNGGQHKLCPALNYASALLALKSANINRVNVSQAALADYKIGPTVGIPGLPQDLPTPANLVKGPWSVCADGSGVTTLVGGAPVNGTPLTTSNVELVQSQGQDWVLYQGSRFTITDKTMRELWPQASPQQVTPAWLNTLPENPGGFAAPAVPGWGLPVTGPDGKPAQVGQVYLVASTGQGQYFVLESDQKLHSVSQVQANLLEHEPGAPAETSLPASQETTPGTPVPSGGLPTVVTTIPQVASPLCVTYGTGMSRTISAGGTIPANATPTGNGGPMTVDRVWLPQGRGALIGVTASPGQPTANSWFLLDGVTRYGLAGPGVASFLGYNLASDEVMLPASLVDVLPTGRALDPGVADQPVSG